MDAEGVNLGKECPLTLLQIGTVDNKVYLFDIRLKPELFKKGHVEDLLQSGNTVKVIHSCTGHNSAALYHQFGIQLKNVFDTQVAHLVIEQSRGRRLPIPIKLFDVCQRYGDNPEPLEQKDTLIVYEAPSKRRQARVGQIVESIISDIERKYETDIKFEDITDEDEINTIHNIRFDKVGIVPFIMRLRTGDNKAQLKEVSDQLSKEGNRLLPKWQTYGFLRAYQFHPDKDIQESAKHLQKP
ncbi:EGL [Mytilus edulis]|uniref:EXD1 n=1 Tax=Mytilus edulis TaxID=6550 RepID=A0A8S3TI95_MYTED|nr:EGL [Mytilus edulis]